MGALAIGTGKSLIIPRDGVERPGDDSSKAVNIQADGDTTSGVTHASSNELKYAEVLDPHHEQSFDQFIATVASEVKSFDFKFSFRGQAAPKIRDIMRPYQTSYWKEWINRFHGGTYDPALASVEQLRSFLEALGKWHEISKSRGEMTQEKFESMCSNISRDKARIFALADS